MRAKGGSQIPRAVPMPIPMSLVRLPPQDPHGRTTVPGCRTQQAGPRDATDVDSDCHTTDTAVTDDLGVHVTDWRYYQVPANVDLVGDDQGVTLTDLAQTCLWLAQEGLRGAGLVRRGRSGPKRIGRLSGSVRVEQPVAFHHRGLNESSRLASP